MGENNNSTLFITKTLLFYYYFLIPLLHILVCLYPLSFYFILFISLFLPPLVLQNKVYISFDYNFTVSPKPRENNGRVRPLTISVKLINILNMDHLWQFFTNVRSLLISNALYCWSIISSVLEAFHHNSDVLLDSKGLNTLLDRCG